jgi:hypothetical protein
VGGGGHFLPFKFIEHTCSCMMHVTHASWAAAWSRTASLLTNHAASLDKGLTGKGQGNGGAKAKSESRSGKVAAEGQLLQRSVIETRPQRCTKLVGRRRRRRITAKSR